MRMRTRSLWRWAFLALAFLPGGLAAAEPLAFRWPVAAEAVVTQATIDHFGNFSLQYRLRTVRHRETSEVRTSASGYRLLYHNRLLLEGRRLDAFNMLGILHRLSIPTFVADGEGRLLRTERADPQEIETAFLQNVGSQRAASLRQWYVERRPGDFHAVRTRSVAYWQAQIPYWEYWVDKWRRLFGREPPDEAQKNTLSLAGLRVPGRTRLIERLPAPDCPACIAVAAEDRFSREDLAPHLEELAARLGFDPVPERAPMTGMRAYVRTEAIIDWQTMLPYRVQAMTIAFQDLADGTSAAADQTKHFYFEWRPDAAGRGAQ